MLEGTYGPKPSPGTVGVVLKKAQDGTPLSSSPRGDRMFRRVAIYVYIAKTWTCPGLNRTPLAS